MLKRAALQGDMYAQYMLAGYHIHMHSKGVPKDYLEARRLLTLASAQGHRQAPEGLALVEGKIRAECPFLGKRVMITGTSREDLNGRVGLVRSFDEARGRYLVRLDRVGVGESTAHSRQEISVRPVNLKFTSRWEL